jgi:signal transduction histidine kinase
MLAAGNLTEEQRDYIEIIEQSGYKMLNMINLSLDLLKMEQGSYELSASAVDILRVARKVVAEFAALCARRGVSAAFVLAGEPVGEGSAFAVIGEELLCYCLLSNLMKNAIEHSLAGGEVTLALNQVADGGCELRLRNVGETAPDFRARFFDKYATHGKPGGTGLGTYSARLMARTMGGDLRLDASVPGETTLVLRLPCP